MKVHYVSGSRADFGLMQLCLQHIAQSGRHDLGIVITGQHLLDAYGNSVADIRAANLEIAGEIPVALSGADGSEMARALANELIGCLDLWQQNRPDLVMVLGDRGEMLAATLAAVHLGIHVAHIHGGERSGTLDEGFRHAITKLAHIHWPATEDAAERLRRMGERPETIAVIGAPGLVGLKDGISHTNDSDGLRSRFGLALTGPLSLVVFHPVVQEAESAAEQMQVVVEALKDLGHAMIILRPNSDAGGMKIDRYLDGLADDLQIAVVTHLNRVHYLSLLANANLIVGNSSSGIIESASFETPCLNLGSRQTNRLRNTNTIDCPNISYDIVKAKVHQALALKGPFSNAYGDGSTDARLLSILDGLSLEAKLLDKSNAY